MGWCPTGTGDGVAGAAKKPNAQARCGGARGEGEDGGIGLGEFGEEVGAGCRTRGPRTGSAARRGAGEGVGLELEYYWTTPGGRGSVAGDTCAFGDGVSPFPVSSFCVFFYIKTHKLCFVFLERCGSGLCLPRFQ